MTNQEKLYKKIAEQEGLNKYQVEDIFKSQFDLVAKEMEAMSDAWIRLPRIGIFLVAKQRRFILERNKKQRNENQQD
jgi:nucleoid DNA-binding protein